MGELSSAVSASMGIRCQWFRRRYIVEGDDILPFVRSSVVPYDPFEQNGKQSLVAALVGLDTGNTRSVEDFTSRWGLLGLLFDPLAEFDLVNVLGQATEYVAPDLHLRAYPTGCFGGDAVVWHEAGYISTEIWPHAQRYLPTPTGLPLSEVLSFPLWLDYMQEPLKEFRTAVRDFRRTFTRCVGWRESRRSRDHAGLLEHVRAHLRHVLPSPRNKSLGWSCPSLLSAAYAMLLPYLSENPDVRICARKGCRRPFVSDRTARLFCSPACQASQKQYEYRQQRKSRQSET